MKIGVIGGGLGGLSAALSLAASEHQVTIFEAESEFGGKAGNLEAAGYRFDTGPSLLTLPHVFDRLFNLTGVSREDYFSILPLDPITNYWFSDGTRYKSRPVPYFTDSLVDVFDVAKEEAERYLRYSRKIYDLTHEIFLESSLQQGKTFVSQAALRAYPQILSIDPLRSMHRANRDFFRDPRVVQFLDRFATYNGSNPYRAPATLNNIIWVEHGLGGWAVLGGIYQIVKAMLRRARELGIHLVSSCKIIDIRTDSHRRVRGLVDCQNTVHDFDAVVSDVDVSTLYHTILKNDLHKEYRRYQSLPSSSSGVVFFWGVNRDFPDLGLHNIFFSENYELEFQQIHSEGILPHDPTIYVNITSKVNPEDAPQGSENWFVLVNAPPHGTQNWNSEVNELRTRVLRKLSKTLGTTLSPHIEYESVLSPQDIMERTGSWRGALYGISSNSLSSAFMRHGNVSKQYRGLYLTGGSVHPGGGMPLVVLSGMIAAQQLLRRES
ncbi:phytoene desaturase family protein [Spirochaeta lutea]|uniref:Amine oxidase domain-containing protein n=1 Tax=Spirochaeta lutea TaxID=1480694 RepID=A0A098R125_9SPIO|nr:phytoene desaturase family protein [Spirochaeta lutea]KGE73699.1 hypothetical protein DC28_00210 [Spirochaeta lutea]